MDLIPSSSAFQSRPAMHHVSSQVPANSEYYTLTEVAYGHLMIRSSSDNKSVKQAVKKVTGLDFPTQALSSFENERYSIYWVSPDEYLLLVPEKTEFEVESALRANIEGHFAIVNVTGGQTVLWLSGERAENIVKKSTSYDIHPSNFSQGKVVTTIFAKSQLLLSRKGEDCFQLVIRRSFSDYLWKWIVDAGSRP